jgi:4-hydroxythreonine-4-phosphate dehydrogenase
MSRFRPLLAITMGDPAGVGPEILLAALATPAMHERCRALVVGDARILERAARFLGAAGPALRFEVVRTPTDARFLDGHITVLDLANAPPDDCPVGQVSAASGRASVEYVFEACDLARRHEVDRTKAGKVSMLLVGPKLRVVHVSTHVALEEAIGRVTRQRVGEVIDLAAQACRVLGVDAPRIAVAGLNPHAGEGGLFGHQEAREIVPAIEDARARGLDVSDPQPPDTVFLRAVRGAYDIVVAMYHDQGHIPMKLLAFDEGVNVSLGLPIIRTSVDHGTAFDIAGTGQARADSLHAAIDVALQMVRAREAAAARA